MQAFRAVKQGEKMSLQAAWQSKRMDAPGAPTVINGVVFALATGRHRGTANPEQFARRSRPATLYALDAENGHELWNSGRQITSYVDSSALSFSPGQVYIGTADNTLYAFGFPVPRQ